MAPERAEAVRSAAGTSPQAAMVMRHPLLFAVIFLVLGLATLQVTPGLFTAPPGSPPVRERWVVEFIACAVVVVVLFVLGWFPTVGLTPPRQWRSVHLVWLPVLVLVLIAVAELRESNASFSLLNLPSAFLVGFFEEALVRGLILVPLLYAWQSVLRAVLTSSALYAGAHLLNLARGEPLANTLLQVVGAFVIGVGLAGLLLRTNTLWLGITWVAVADWLASATPEAQPPVVAFGAGLVELALMLPMLFYGLWLVKERGAARRGLPRYI